MSVIRMLRQSTPRKHRRYNGAEARNAHPLLPLCGYLADDFVVHCFPHVQTKHQIEQLPIGCGYRRVPVLESPIPRPYHTQKNLSLRTESTWPVSLRRHNFSSTPDVLGQELVSLMAALFPEPPSGFIMECGLHLERL